ncbi:MAG: cytochrome P460 family protein [Cellvibrionaceae bacterium]|nr:cytochrome P460 family protein [Cellvibrionaceae bacterium]
MKKLLFTALTAAMLFACGGDDDDSDNGDNSDPGGNNTGGGGQSTIQSSTGVDFPVGWQDMKTIAATDRLGNGTLVLILGNEAAVNSAENITNNGATAWDEGSVIVRSVWRDRINSDSADTLAPGNFVSLTVMEKNANDFNTTEGWGYGLWRGDQLGAADTTENIVNNETCFACHNREVPDKDFVFTNPVKMPSQAAVSSAAASSGITLPANVTNWQFINVHKRVGSQQVRVILGNPTAVEAARLGLTNPWPEGSQIADFVFAGAGNADSADMLAAGNFAALAYMEKDSTLYPDENGNWGYGFWRGENLAAEDAANEPIVNNETCASCHNREVAENDFVFTRPGNLPSAAGQ